MSIREMNHFTILAEDLEVTRRFYGEVLGFREGYRPPLKFPGAWFYVGERAILHVIARNPLPKERRGVLDHMAYSATGLKGWLARLKEHDIAHEVIHQVGSEVWQVFFFDPSGAKIELDFAPDEEPPSPA